MEKLKSDRSIALHLLFALTSEAPSEFDYVKRLEFDTMYVQFLGSRRCNNLWGAKKC